MLWPRTMRRLWAVDPWEEMRRLQREMGRVFAAVAPALARRVFPAVNLWVGRDRAVVTATAVLPRLVSSTENSTSGRQESSRFRGMMVPLARNSTSTGRRGSRVLRRAWG